MYLRRLHLKDICTSGSATSVDLGDLPFDMPKLRRRLRTNPTEINHNILLHSTESSGISQASSSHSMRDDGKGTNLKLGKYELNWLLKFYSRYILCTHLIDYNDHVSVSWSQHFCVIAFNVTLLNVISPHFSYLKRQIYLIDDLS